MTLMYILATGDYSGAEKVIITIIKHMKERNRCVYVSPKGTIGGILEQEEIEHLSINRLDLISVSQAVNTLNPDIIHANDFRASIFASNFGGRCKIISHIHCNPTWIKHLNVNSLVYGLASIRFYKILNVSNAFQQEYIFKNLKSIKSKCQTIGNPVSAEYILGQAHRSSDKIKKYDMMYIGRLSEEKNPLGFIEVFYELWKENKRLTAMIIGDGGLREKCKIKIVEMGISNNIDMLGFKENPYPYMKNGKVMVISSKYEGFGLAAVEALTLGKPVIASKVGGLAEIITDKCGALCTSKDDFVYSLKMILDNDKQYLLMSDEAKKRASNFDNLHSYMNKISEIYDSCMK